MTLGRVRPDVIAVAAVAVVLGSACGDDPPPRGFPPSGAKVVAAPLVKAGAWFTVSVKLCVASGATPLVAVIVIG